MAVDEKDFQMFREGTQQLASMAPPSTMPDERRVEVAKTTMLAKLTADMAFELESCVHCGQCAEACHFYQATHDAKYTPIRKLDLLKRVYRREQAPLRWLHRLYTPDVTIDDLHEWQELVYDSCTECGRCFMVCPMGINIAAMVNVNRQAFANAELMPAELRALEMEQGSGYSLFGMGPEQVEGFLTHLRDSGVNVRMNESGVDYLLLTSVVEIMIFRDALLATIRVLEHLGLSWTIHCEGYEAANFGMLSGVEAVQKVAGDRVVRAVKASGAKTVLVPECGHAYPSLRWDQANLDARGQDFEVLTVSEFLGREVEAGRLKLRPIGKGKKVTFHDPCKLGRHSGVFHEPRVVLEALGVDFREVESSQELNWCCGGGAGVFLLNRASGLRQGAWTIKQQQLDATGADSVVLSCASCRLNFMNGARAAHWDKGIESLVELAAAQLAD
ncbi:MAG: (Fe-S)-binding protein [Gammaproteobacteria bacterium]|nr:(Fe-S)-binding protein [Gammaproteobacteria bacterium]